MPQSQSRTLASTLISNEPNLSASEARDEVLRIMEQAEAIVDSATGPTGDRKLLPRQVLVFGLWMSCRDLHEAIGTLLSRRFYVEARILARTMITDFLRLLFLYNHRVDLEIWAIRYMLHSFDQEEHRLVKSAKELHLTFAKS